MTYQLSDNPSFRERVGGVPSVQAVVKVGDTVSDIQEGQERQCLLARRARGQRCDGHDAGSL